VDQLACVDAAALPLQILLQMHPEWLHLPVAVVEDDRPQALVLFINERARKAGVRTGHRYTAALALAPDLQAAVVPRSRIDETVRALSDGLRRYSPHVEPSTQTPGLFWLDAGGLGRLYPSLREWAAAVRLEMQRAGVRATVAVGASRFGTYALAKFHPGITVCADPAEERAVVGKVPIDTLDLDPMARDRLSALGIKTVGDFLRLPGDSLRQRLGPAADALFQLATGRTWAPLQPAAVEERHERQLDFDAPETNTERVLFVVKRVLDALVEDLSRRANMIVTLTLHLTLDNRTKQAELVRPAAPTLDAVQLLTLVRLRLDALHLSSGIVVLRVAAETCRATSDQLNLLPQGRRDPEAANQAFARLRAELGDDAVVCARLCDAHLPGARFAWDPIAQMPTQSTARVVPARPLVRRIYVRPAFAKADKPRTRNPEPGTRNPEPGTRNPEPGTRSLSGPFVLSGAWWLGGLHRDYFFAETTDGGLEWMYFDHQKKRMFLQGDVE
jgi:protein ImuB